LRLVVQDFEGPIVSGPERIVVDRGSGIRFFVYGSTDVEGTAFLRLLASHDNTYDPSQQFRLFATDYEGNEWVGGHTAPEHFADHVHGWPLTGELRGLSTRVAGPWVAEISSVELLFAPAPDLPLSEWMTTTTILGSEELIASRTPGRQAIEMLGTEVVFGGGEETQRPRFSSDFGQGCESRLRASRNMAQTSKLRHAR
jgi:hypothetical protein